MKTKKLYDSTRHPEKAANIAVVGNLTILVHLIQANEVLFVLNPNIQTFSQNSTTQNVEFEATDDTQLQRLVLGSNPLQVHAGDKIYELSLVEIGSDNLPSAAGQLQYCIFEVVESSPRSA